MEWMGRGDGPKLAVALALPSLGSFFLLPPDTGRLEMLSAADLRKNAVLLDALVKPLEQTLEGLTFG